MGFHWAEDVLGDEFRCLTLPLPPDDEGHVVATIVSPKDPPIGPTTRVLLYLHGWSDYFHQRELAQFWTDAGFAFYALDLRKYGRSLRPWQTSGYVTDLVDYDSDIEAALSAIQADLRNRGIARETYDVSMMGHSTGGLVAALWTQRNPGAVSALVLNSPWLDFTGSSIIRSVTVGLFESIARIRPRTRIKLPEFGFYWRSISQSRNGEWDLDEQWRPEFGFPVTAGWLSAVLTGHNSVNRGLRLSLPILVLTSAASTISPVWKETMMASDSVLDVDLMRDKALKLGDHITVVQLHGALHDVLLSPLEVRQQAYAVMRRWAEAYMPASQQC
ncbi:alpha/beta hydrolase [Arthrobacter roseus]|uniref:alpha/beta hydrolase n=1 Tax=Arthrobacter roseus TaxID=136274 RepID=UPI001966713D|nr:alpha/beta hydrolase [Arthrobacter roseus]MBM7848598.1 alpha-beta hydrolase superfamily lysophospholipase [Arthrobacter roseus]